MSSAEKMERGKLDASLPNIQGKFTSIKTIKESEKGYVDLFKTNKQTNKNYSYTQIALEGSKPPRSVGRPVSGTHPEPSGHRNPEVAWDWSFPISTCAQS